MEKLRFNANTRQTITIDWDKVTKGPESSKNHCDWHDMRLVNGQCSICKEIFNENGRRIENE